jgi:hypothetical protein
MEIDDLTGRGALGFAEVEKPIRIVMDIVAHRSDRDVRSTLLHEMAHLAAGPKNIGHGAAFFAQVEALLAQGAPLRVDLGETQNHPLLDSVPSRFKLTHQALERVYERRRRQIEQNIARGIEINGTVVKVQREIPIEACVENDFESAALEGCTWKDSLFVLGRQFGLVDNDGRPLAGAGALIRLARRTYLRVRRQVKQEERDRAWFDAIPLAASCDAVPGGDPVRDEPA